MLNQPSLNEPPLKIVDWPARRAILVGTTRVDSVQKSWQDERSPVDLRVVESAPRDRDAFDALREVAALIQESPERFFAENSRSFSFAARLFPPDQRRKVTLVYAFCRVTDDIVDEHMRKGEVEEAGAELRAWESLARQAYAGQTTGITFLDEIMRISADAEVPFSLIEALIEGVRSDMGPVEMETWEDLRAYCYRVASVIGLWITQLFGLRDPQILERAEMMGYALQLTNILRDVGEDLGLDRVYLPRELLEAHGLCRADLEAMKAGEQSLSPAYREMVEATMDVAENCYALAFEALAHLPGFYARPMAAAATIYHGILTEIRHNTYDNLKLRAHTSSAAKVTLASRGLRRLYLRLPRRIRPESALSPTPTGPESLPIFR
jgi:phytoene synthase